MYNLINIGDGEGMEDDVIMDADEDEEIAGIHLYDLHIYGYVFT
jgi:uncharacterized protein YuzE